MKVFMKMKSKVRIVVLALSAFLITSFAEAAEKFKVVPLYKVQIARLYKTDPSTIFMLPGTEAVKQLDGSYRIVTTDSYYTRRDARNVMNFLRKEGYSDAFPIEWGVGYELANIPSQSSINEDDEKEKIK